MNNPDALNKDQLTNTGDVKNPDQKEQGIKVAAEENAQEQSGDVESKDIPFYAEKKAVLDFFGAERVELDEPHISEGTDMDCIVKLYRADGSLIDIGSHNLREAYAMITPSGTYADLLAINPTDDAAPKETLVESGSTNDEEGLAPLSDAQKAWIALNPRFDTDLDFQAEAIGAHEVAIQKGLVVDSEEYFTFIDARLKLVFPDVAQDVALSASQQATVTDEEQLRGVDGAGQSSGVVEPTAEEPKANKAVSSDPENG